jgi:disulfide bond formation protein DsbB
MSDDQPSSGLPIRSESGILGTFERLLRANGYYIAVLAAWIATLGSLYLSEVMNFEPCRLCWYQRIAMYPLAVLIPVGLLKRNLSIPTYVFPLTIIGIVLSTYHRLLEEGIITTSIACEKGVSCAARWINWYGFITIPTLALVAFLVITLSVSASRRAPEWAHPEARAVPWRGVLVAIGVALLFMTYIVVTDGR